MKTISAALLAWIVACVFVASASQAHAAKSRYDVLYSFCPGVECTDGTWPYAGLVDVNGTLYGTTSLGGGPNGGAGAVFGVNPKTGQEQVIYAFCAKTHGFNCVDGTVPRTGLIAWKGLLYGTTQSGGSIGGGTVFSIDPATGTQTVIHNFGNDGDGVFPESGLIAVKGILYGTTLDGGGSCACGTVFSVDPNTGVETVLHVFAGGTADGSGAVAGLTFLNGNLYGTTRMGGSFDSGVIFSVALKTGKQKVLYSFCAQFGCPDGGDPETSMIVLNGKLYGTTDAGGSTTYCLNTDFPRGCGTIFSFDPKTGTETVLHAFCGQSNCTDGAFPEGNLINLDGKFYGTTRSGGEPAGCFPIPGCGTIFSVDQDTGAQVLLHSFASRAATDGMEPVSGLFARKGKLFGTTFSGGDNDRGTVFRLNFQQ